MTTISVLIEENKKSLDKQHNKFIDAIFYERYQELPNFIQDCFHEGYSRIFRKENLPIDNISSLNKDQLSFYIRQMDSYYSCLNFLKFHEKMMHHYELPDIQIFFKIQKINPLKNHIDSHLKIIRGLLSLLDYEVILPVLKECSLIPYLDRISNLPELKISDSFTDNPKLVKEKIQLMLQIINF